MDRNRDRQSVTRNNPAVFSGRVEAATSLDDFPTPPWATRALCEHLLTHTDPILRMRSCREPAANRGHMVRPLQEYFKIVLASDVHDYQSGFPPMDYLKDQFDETDWTITNPPFNLATKFIDKALAHSRIGAAMLTRTSFLESIKRYTTLFSVNPPTEVLQFSERVVIHKARLSPKGSTATSYCWLVWDVREPPAQPTTLRWLAPCRKLLERPEDYPFDAI